MKILASLMVVLLALTVGCKTMECKKGEKAEKAEAAPAAKIEMKAVESSTMDAIGYDAEQQVLKIKFDSGDTYKYMDVPEATYKKMMKSKSKGKFFDAHIKDKFEAKKCD